MHRQRYVQGKCSLGKEIPAFALAGNQRSTTPFFLSRPSDTAGSASSRANIMRVSPQHNSFLSTSFHRIAPITNKPIITLKRLGRGAPYKTDLASYASRTCASQIWASWTIFPFSLIQLHCKMPHARNR
ncbi:hypothetical protein EJ04DRAFT_66306 [Polyplosphaeria fusca]|uniref:Uncharacterized protein n=1 Tax=Polyplosphaeria fusca TaxID=682080 RepID=A0A9P4QR96_9PLEO|nr:hypothetical protein EJ04DRAFT_66306 [Polyplosphaeria fusca]